MPVSTLPFGRTAGGEPVTAYRLTNAGGSCLTVLDYGATIQSLCVPNGAGGFTDVVLGYDTLGEYEDNGGFLGATIGRVGNRIGGASFSLNGVRYDLARNDGDNHLHGGNRGFDKRMWQVSPREDALVCTRLSPDGEEGYPGNLQVQVTFTLTADNTLRIQYDALSDRDTLVNLTNHSYFNLNGGGSVLEHRLYVNAERFCENDAGCLPTGKLLDVEGTPFDFRIPKPIGAHIEDNFEQLRRGGGYDHNYVLSGKHAATLYSPDSGIELVVETDLPGMQVYSANSLTRRNGKGGSILSPRDAICLETQLFPNGMNCYGFPSPVLRAGRQLHTETAFQFGVRHDNESGK